MSIKNQIYTLKQTEGDSALIPYQACWEWPPSLEHKVRLQQLFKVRRNINQLTPNKTRSSADKQHAARHLPIRSNFIGSRVS